MNFVLDSICNQINEEHVSLESIFKDIDGNPLTRGRVMKFFIGFIAAWLAGSSVNINAEVVRAAYPSANVQFLPAFVALEKGFYKREGLNAELISVRNAVTAVQALIGNQIHFIFSVGPQMPSIWEGGDIVLLAQQVGRPTFSMIVTQDIKSVSDLKGKKIGVSFGGSTFAGTKALLELNKMNPDKDVQYVSIPGSQPKIAAMQQGIVQAALLAPPADYVALKAGFKRLVNLADIFKETSFSGLAATGKTIKENPQFVKRMVRAMVRGITEEKRARRPPR